MERVAKRILIDIRESSKYRYTGWDDPDKVIGSALGTLKKQNLIPQETEHNDEDIRLILRSIGKKETRIIFDIFHDSFDAAQAHLYGQDLPVIIVSMKNGTCRKVFEANHLQTHKVNFGVRFLFNRYGMGSQPPFSEDTRQGSVPFPLKNFRDPKAYHAQLGDGMANCRQTESGSS